MEAEGGEIMNIWTQKSIELANQRDYLDQLFKIYPLGENLVRSLGNSVVEGVKKAMDERNNVELIETLLKHEKFPFKDSYVAFLRDDKTAAGRNPQTVNRLAGKIYEMGFEKVINKMSEPKETNTQMGNLFRGWLQKGSLGAELTTDEDRFLNEDGNFVLNLSDAGLMQFARQNLGYTKEKGLDLVVKFNNIFVIAEAKFITSSGGNQDKQMDDAITTLRARVYKTEHNVLPIAIIDGVPYLETKNSKAQKAVRTAQNDEHILSALFLREFLYAL